MAPTPPESGPTPRPGSRSAIVGSSILDLSEAGAQPMRSDCGRFAVTFNGEIYNHLDIRAELDAAGAAPNWRGHSDTETLLAAVKQWGVAATLPRIIGMFAFALWDAEARTLTLSATASARSRCSTAGAAGISSSARN